MIVVDVCQTDLCEMVLNDRINCSVFIFQNLFFSNLDTIDVFLYLFVRICIFSLKCQQRNFLLVTVVCK